MDGFERWIKRHVPIRNQPFVTIQRGGRTMSVNRAAHELLGAPEAVELLFSRERNAVGIRPVAASEPYAVPVRPQGRQGHTPSNYVVAVGGFVNDYDIPSEVAMRYPVKAENDALIVELDHGTDATGPRLKERAVS